MNVLEALHDLTHEPTSAERVAFAVQATLDELEQLIGPLALRGRDAFERAVREALGRAHNRALR